MTHEVLVGESNKAGTEFWNRISVGPHKGKPVGPVFKTESESEAWAKKRSDNYRTPTGGARLRSQARALRQ